MLTRPVSRACQSAHFLSTLPCPRRINAIVERDDDFGTGRTIKHSLASSRSRPSWNRRRSGEFEQARSGKRAKEGKFSVTATIDVQSDTASVSPLARRLAETRRLSLSLAEPLSAEDQVVQPMDDASPTKWHLAHTTWFFETFVLKPHLPGFRTLDERFAYCFNSYYEAAGPRQPRARARAAHAPDRSTRCCAIAATSTPRSTPVLRGRCRRRHRAVAELIELGINHEQQHQELILTDILRLFASQPLRPAYRPAPRPTACAERRQLGAARWLDFPGGIHRDRPRRRRPSPSTTSGRATRSAARRIALAEPAGHQRRVAAVHGRRRLRHARSSGCPTAGPRSRPRAGRRRVYWEGEDGDVAADDAARPAPGRARRAGLPRQLLRGGRLRALGRQAAADRVRMGGGRQRRCRCAATCSAPARCARCRRPRRRGRQARPDVRRRVGVDAERLRRLSGLPAGPGALGEYNGKFMCGQMCCAAARAPRRQGTRARPIAISSIRISAGSSPASAWRTTHDPAWQHAASTAARRSLPSRRIRARRCSRASPSPASGCRASTSTTPPAASCSRRSPSSTSTIPTRTETAILREHAREMARPAGRGARCWSSSARAPAARPSCVLAALDSPARLCADRHLASALAEARAATGRRFPGLEIVPGRMPTSARRCGCRRACSAMPSSASSRAPRSATSTRRTPAACSRISPACSARLAADRRRRSRQGPAAAGGRLRRREGRHGARSISTCWRASIASSAATSTSARFRHRAIYDRELKRIEMHLVSRARQTVRVLGRSFPFAAGETHPHGELLQVFAGAVPRARAGRRVGSPHECGWTPARTSACTSSLPDAARPRSGESCRGRPR